MEIALWEMVEAIQNLSDGWLLCSCLSEMDIEVIQRLSTQANSETQP